MPSCPLAATPVTKRACPFTWVRPTPPCRDGQPITPTGNMVAPNDCSLLPHHRQLEQHHAAGRSHAESGESGLRRVSCHGTGGLHAGDARRQSGSAYRHCGQLRTVPRRRRRADLVQQFHAEGCGADALAHSVSVGHRLQLLPCLDLFCGRWIRADEHDAGVARLRRRRPARPATRRACRSTWARRARLAGPPGRSHTGTMVAPNDCSLCHTTANWNSTATADRAHAEPRKPGLRRLPHGGADQLHDARGQFGLAHRHRERLRAMPRRHVAR